MAHVYNREKEQYLPYKMKNDHIKEASETMLITMGKRWHYYSRDNPDPNVSAKEVLMAIATDCEADICVVGYHGRKGPKEDPTVMGSAVQYLTTGSTCPTLIIKDPVSLADTPENLYRYACCIDGSEKSMKALGLICTVKHKTDPISIIICE